MCFWTFDQYNWWNGFTGPFDTLWWHKILKKNFYTATNRKNLNTIAHLRGCPCNVKPCVSLCCPLDGWMYGTCIIVTSVTSRVLHQAWLLSFHFKTNPMILFQVGLLYVIFPVVCIFMVECHEFWSMEQFTVSLNDYPSQFFGLRYFSIT